MIQQMTEKSKWVLDEIEKASLTKNCIFPMKPLPKGTLTMSILSTYTGQPIPNFLGIVTLCKIMILRGKMAEMENRPEDAVRDYITVIRTGNHFDQSLAISRMIGVAMRTMGSQALDNFIAKPGSVSQATLVFNELKEMEPPKRIDWESLKDYEFILRENDYDQTVREEMNKLKKNDVPAFSILSTRYDIACVKQELAYLGAAIRIYQSKNNKLPNSLDELTPSIIPVSLTDPFSEQSYHYINNGTEIVLYSVGS